MTENACLDCMIALNMTYYCHEYVAILNSENIMPLGLSCVRGEAENR